MSVPTEPRAGLRRTPSRDILSGESADVYFSRAEEILSKENLDPVVVMEVFGRRDAVLCGIDEAKVLLAHVLTENGAAEEATVEALADGDLVAPKEVVLRIHARYRAFGLFETALLGHDGPVDGLGDGRARVRRGSRAGAGHLVRRASCPP